MKTTLLPALMLAATAAPVEAADPLLTDPVRSANGMIMLLNAADIDMLRKGKDTIVGFDSVGEDDQGRIVMIHTSVNCDTGMGMRTLVSILDPATRSISFDKTHTKLAPLEPGSAVEVHAQAACRYARAVMGGSRQPPRRLGID